MLAGAPNSGSKGACALGALEELLEFALQDLGKGGALPLHKLPGEQASLEGAHGDLGEERLLWLGGSNIQPFLYSREWPVKRAVPRKIKPGDLGQDSPFCTIFFSSKKWV